MQGAPRELAVPDLAATRKSKAACFANGVGREVVMKQEVFPIIPVQSVDNLLVLPGAKGRHHQRLSFAAREQSAAVGTRKEADFGGDGPHRTGVASVDTLAGVQDIAAYDIFLQVFQDFGQHPGNQLLIEGGVRFQFSGDFLLDRRQLFLACLFDGLAVGGAQIGLARGAHTRHDFLFAFRRRGNVPRLLGAGLGEVDNGIDDRLKGLMAEGDGAQHDLLGKLAGLRFDHQHPVTGTGDDQIERAIRQFVDLRIEDVRVGDISDPATGDRPHEGKTRYRQRGGSADQGHDVWIVFQVVGKHGADDLRLVLKALGEQRPDGAVDEPRGKCFFLGGPALSLEKAAGNLAGGKCLFLVMDGEGEEVQSRPRRPFADHGAQHLCFAVGRHDGAVGLAGNLASLESQRATPPLDFLSDFLKHT